MYDEEKFNSVISALSCFKTAIKYERVTPYVLLYGGSAYIEGEWIKAKIDFTDTCFEEITSIPFGKTFEYSENPRDSLLAMEINKINKLARSYCDTLFHLERLSLMEFMDYNYNSLAKLNKVNAKVVSEPEPRFYFHLLKKSTSVYESEYIVDTTKQIHPSFRLSSSSVNISAIMLYLAITNPILSNTIKIEVNSRLGFVRVSCSHDNIRARFIILEKNDIKNTDV